jgi:hypothetical protein
LISDLRARIHNSPRRQFENAGAVPQDPGYPPRPEVLDGIEDARIGIEIKDIGPGEKADSVESSGWNNPKGLVRTLPRPASQTTNTGVRRIRNPDTKTDEGLPCNIEGAILHVHRRLSTGPGTPRQSADLRRR